MRSAISYFGGKARLAPTFVTLFPDHARFVDVFGGSGAVLFAHLQEGIEVYNDLDSALYEFFTVLASPQLFGRFRRAVEALPCSRQLHIHCFNTWSREKTIVGRVSKWYVAMRQCFSGEFQKSWAYAVKNGSNGRSQAVTKWLGGIDRLPEIHARLQGVQIDNRDFRQVITAYDMPDTLFYFDPPYVPETRKSGKYRCELTVEDHQDLVDRLLQLEGYAMLSGYQTDLYKPLEKAGWDRREFAVTCSAAARTKGTGLKGPGKVTEKQKRVEVIWTNYDLPTVA